jgi:hypothetical protein
LKAASMLLAPSICISKLPSVMPSLFISTPFLEYCLSQFSLFIIFPYLSLSKFSNISFDCFSLSFIKLLNAFVIFDVSTVLDLSISVSRTSFVAYLKFQIAVFVIFVKSSCTIVDLSIIEEAISLYATSLTEFIVILVSFLEFFLKMLSVIFKAQKCLK